MIKIEYTDVSGWKAAIRGMRNPMESWDKSDSKFYTTGCGYNVGENDLKLMLSLVKAGSDHSKFMRMINVTCDIIAPLYWWKEFDTYKVGTVRNSCSTMHKIHARELSLKDFSREHLVDPAMFLKNTINVINRYRAQFLKAGDKGLWWQMIQLLPSSYNQRSTVQLNYAVLRNMYHSRRNHKLDEWRGFCRWVEGLPYSELITV